MAMGRAIVREPAAFLLDEPLSNLDAKLRAQMRTEIARLQRRLETTMVYVTHDQAEAMTLGHHIAVLRKGRLQQVGTPRELYREPVNLFVAGFMGSPPTNFLPATVRDGTRHLPILELPLPERLKEALTAGGGGGEGEYIAGIRPEDFREVPEKDAGSAGKGVEGSPGGAALGAPGNGPAGSPRSDIPTFRPSVELVEWLGADLYLHFQVESDGSTEMARTGDKLRELARDLEMEEPREGRRRLTARMESGSGIREGDTPRLTVDPEKIMLFHRETGRRMGQECAPGPS